MNDVLHSIALSDSAAARWLARARAAAQELGRDGVWPDEIPDEQARIEQDGSLTIYVVIRDREISLRVEPDEWSWRV